MNATATVPGGYVMDSGIMLATIVCIVTSQVFNFFVGLPLNCYVVTLLLSKAGGVDVFVIFPLNHTVAEIIFTLVAPLYIACIISLEYCVGPLLGFWLGTFMPARYLFQCWVCLERYLAVVWPVTFLRFKPLRYRVACSAMAWMCALALGISSMCTFPLLPYNALGGLYVMVFLLDSFCAASILRGLLRAGPGDEVGAREDGEMNSAKKNAFKIVCMNLVTFLVQIIPISISFGLQYALPPDHFQLAVAVGMSINIAAAFVHPFFVLHKAGKLTCKCS